MTPPSPLTGPPPAEVPLPRAPLARVIAQVQFAPILAIRNPDVVATFQEVIRGSYPVLSEDRIRQIVVMSAGTPDIREGVIWRFSDGEKRQWRTSLSVDFVAFRTSAGTIFWSVSAPSLSRWKGRSIQPRLRGSGCGTLIG
jgi:hypothetical protein